MKKNTSIIDLSKQKKILDLDHYFNNDNLGG